MKFTAIPTDSIEIDPKVCNGKPVIRGTRVPVSDLLEQIAEGELWDDLLRNYPELKREDIQAALLYATASLDHMEIRATPIQLRAFCKLSRHPFSKTFKMDPDSLNSVDKV